MYQKCTVHTYAAILPEKIDVLLIACSLMQRFFTYYIVYGHILE
jgi:hypothetical protein